MRPDVLNAYPCARLEMVDLGKTGVSAADATLHDPHERVLLALLNGGTPSEQ